MNLVINPVIYFLTYLLAVLQAECVSELTRVNPLSRPSATDMLHASIFLSDDEVGFFHCFQFQFPSNKSRCSVICSDIVKNLRFKDKDFLQGQQHWVTGEWSRNKINMF